MTNLLIPPQISATQRNFPAFSETLGQFEKTLTGNRIMSNPAIAFFAGRLLPPSETFIRAQGENLQQFNPYYVGTRLVTGLPLPKERTFVVNEGGIFGAAQEVVFKQLGYAPKLFQKVQAFHPVLVHAHFGVCGALALPLVRKLKVPLIVTFYGLDATMKDIYAQKNSISTQVYLRRREALKQEASLFIGVSEFIKETLLGQGFPAEKVIAHYYGVDTESFSPDPNIKRDRIVLFVGRLAEKKGCEYLIRAMAEVQTLSNDVQLVIIGDGPLKSDLEALAAKSLQRYQFLGLQPSSVVKSWMNRAWLLAVPSITAQTGDSEGLPTVVVEAQAMGLPVVGSIHAGIPQAVIHGETGFLAPERDWQALAEFILQLLKDPILWQRFSENGQRRVRKYFDLYKQTRHLETIYQSILEKKSIE